jgi:hypothetical protein
MAPRPVSRTAVRPLDRIVPAVALTVGLALIVLTFVLSLPGRTAGAERTTDRFRQLMTPAGLVGLRRDFEVVHHAGLQFRDRALPDFARALRLDQRQMARLMRTQFPAVDAGVRSLPGVFAFVDPNIRNLEARGGKFSNLDAIPTSWLPLNAAAWIFFGLGVLLAGAGALGLARPGRRTTALCGLVGAGMVAIPLAISLPSKAADARDVGNISRGGLSQAGATRASSINDALQAMVSEIHTKMVPALAAKLGTSPASLERKIGRDYPAVGKFLGQFDGYLLPTARGLAARQQASVKDFAEADKTPIRTIPWLLIGPGALLALIAAGSLLAARRGSAPKAVAVA